MKLYTVPLAPNPTKVMLYVAEREDLGTDMGIEQVVVNPVKGQQKAPEHLARNPFGTLPVLELDDGSYLVESLAIIQYLEDRFPHGALLAGTPEDKGKARDVERIVDRRWSSVPALAAWRYCDDRGGAVSATRPPRCDHRVLCRRTDRRLRTVELVDRCDLLRRARRLLLAQRADVGDAADGEFGPTLRRILRRSASHGDAAADSLPDRLCRTSLGVRLQCLANRGHRRGGGGHDRGV